MDTHQPELFPLGPAEARQPYLLSSGIECSLDGLQLLTSNQAGKMDAWLPGHKYFSGARYDGKTSSTSGT